MPILIAEKEPISQSEPERVQLRPALVAVPRAGDPYPAQVDESVSSALRRGAPIMLVDGAGGYLVAGAAGITTDTVNLFTKLGRGIVMLAITPAKALFLGLQLQPRRNAPERMPLCAVSIEAAHGTTTGISAADRALTLRTAADRACERAMLVSPGHIFPVVARNERGGLGIDFATAAIRLLSHAVGQETAACVQVLGDNGDVLSGDALLRFARKHDVPVVDSRAMTASWP